MDKINQTTEDGLPDQRTPQPSDSSIVPHIQENANKETEEQKQNGSDSPNLPYNSKISRRMRSSLFRRIICKPSFTDWIIAIATMVITIATWMTWKEIEKNSSQTDKIIAASERIKEALELSNKQNQDALNITIKQNKESLEKSLAQGEKALNTTITNSKLDQRAWLGLAKNKVVQFEKTKPVKVDIVAINSGKTPALKIMVAAKFGWNSSVTQSPNEEWFKNLNFHPQGSVPPQGTFVYHVNADWDKMALPYEALKENRQTIYVFGEIRYKDISGGSNTTEFCLYISDPTSMDLAMCDTHNNMN